MTPTQVEFTDFSGGITDDYLPGPQNRYQRADNLLITRNKKLESRYGSDLVDSTYYQIPPGNQRITELINFDNNTALLYVSRRNVYYVNAGWNTLTGPSGNAVLDSGADSNRISYAHWNHQLFIVSDSGAKPMKIFKDSGGTFRARTAGLPELAETANYVSATVLTNAITLANDLRTKMLSHFARATIHTAADAVAGAALTASAATNLPTLLTLTTQLLASYSLHYKDAIRGKPTYHGHTMLGEVESPVLFAVDHKLDSSVPPTTLEEAVERLDDLLRRFTGHNYDQDTHVVAISTSVADTPSAPRAGPLTTGAQFSDTLLTSLCDLANELKTQLNLHLLSGGQVSAGPGTWTSGSAVITGLANTTGVTVGDYVILSRDDVSTDDIPFGTRTVASKTGTTVTLNGTLSASGSGIVYFVAANEAHGYAEVPGFRVSSANATSDSTLATLVNELRSKYIYHMNGGGALHMGLFQSTRQSLALTNQIADAALMDLAGYTGDTFGGYHQYEIDGIRQALIELKGKFNAHQKDATAHWVNATAAGYSPYPVLSPDPSNDNYLYAFHLAYEYTSGSETFLDAGPVLIKEAAALTKPDEYAVALSTIPALVNGSLDNYDTATITVRIARTVANGKNFYYIGQVTNGTTTFTDDVSDADLVTGEQLYTEGGVVDNDPPPVSRFLHILNGTAYYGYVTDIDGSIRKNRVRQSITDDPDSCPSDFYIDFDEEVMGLSSVRERPLVLCTDSAYRLEGTFDERGQGGIGKVRISETIGTIAHRSIVQTDYGVFFAGQEGFCWTDGYQVQQISDWDDTYALYTATAAQRSRIQGVYNKFENRIYWTAQLNQAGSDADAAIILHLHNPAISNAMAFTTASGTSFSPTSFCVFNKQLLRADKRGYTFYHSASLVNDKKIDTAVAPSGWVKEPVMYNLTSCGHDYGTASMKKWITRVSLRAKNTTNVSMQVNSNNDDGRQIDALTPIKFRGHITWGDPDVVWGDPNLFWNYQGSIEDSRFFPGGSLRATYKQIQVRNAFVVIEGSDSKGLATVNHIAKTATLVDALIQDWNVDIVDYYIAFEDDGYDHEYLVTTRTSGDVIVFADPGNLLTTTLARKWVVRGYPKNEKLSLLDYTIHHSYLGTKSTEAFVQTSGENA
jgi:hypothetical protein